MKIKMAPLLLAIFWLILAISAIAMPAFGTFPERAPALQSVAVYYLEHGMSQTGALNIVSTIVWDYRGYDTLGEVTVLFTAVLGVSAIMRKVGEK